MTDYMPAVGKKFNADGSVRRFAGSTVICFIPPGSSAFRLAVWAQQQLNASAIGAKITLLPESSLHMTIFGVLNEDKRQAEYWPPHLPLDAPLAQTDIFVEQAVQSVLAPTAGFKMRYGRMIMEDSFIAIGLLPADAEVESNLCGYRDALATATGVRVPNHDGYEFHISLAYPILRYPPAEARGVGDRIGAELQANLGVFTTGLPMLTFYDDMFAFVPAAERHTLNSRQP